MQINWSFSSINTKAQRHKTPVLVYILCEKVGMLNADNPTQLQWINCLERTHAPWSQIFQIFKRIPKFRFLFGIVWLLNVASIKNKTKKAAASLSPLSAVICESFAFKIYDIYGLHYDHLCKLVRSVYLNLISKLNFAIKVQIQGFKRQNEEMKRINFFFFKNSQDVRNSNKASVFLLVWGDFCFR